MLLTALALVVSMQSANVELVSPAPRQVVQRETSGGTDVDVVVRAPRGIGRLVARSKCVDGTSEEVALARASEDGERATFTAKLRVPAGGWHRLAVTVDGIAGPAEVAVNERFGVGDVFVVAGQSNSTNSGEERIGALDDLVSAFDGKSWTLAQDPMPGVQDGSDGGSPWPVCGRALRELTGVPIAFASCGYGGTSLAQWQKGAGVDANGRRVPLFDGLVARVKEVGRFRAILWHQGESDASQGTSTADYVARFKALKDGVQAATGVDATWIVAQASFCPGFEPARLEPVRAAQAELWKSGLALRGPDTDLLLGSLRHSGDKIHFSKSGLERHGARWAAEIYTQLLR